MYDKQWHLWSDTNLTISSYTYLNLMLQLYNMNFFVANDLNVTVHYKQPIIS